jgi:predicted enzyme related to lactoylglutathione lyase
VAWAETHSRDLRASGMFYEGVMGWTHGPESDGYRVFERHGEQVAGMMAMPPGVPAEVPSYWMAYFAVDDVDRGCRRVAELGGSVLRRQ